MIESLTQAKARHTIELATLKARHSLELEAIRRTPPARVSRAVRPPAFPPLAQWIGTREDGSRRTSLTIAECRQYSSYMQTPLQEVLDMALNTSTPVVDHKEARYARPNEGA